MILSPVSDRDSDVYTTGDCYLLAREIWRQGAGEMVIVRGPQKCWSHMAVQVAPNLYLDVDGLRPGEDLLKDFERSRFGNAEGWEVAVINEAEWNEAVDGISPGVDAPERVAELASELIAWAAKAH